MPDLTHETFNRIYLELTTRSRAAGTMGVLDAEVMQDAAKMIQDLMRERGDMVAAMEKAEEQLRAMGADGLSSGIMRWSVPQEWEGMK